MRGARIGIEICGRLGEVGNDLACGLDVACAWSDDPLPRLGGLGYTRVSGATLRCSLAC